MNIIIHVTASGRSDVNVFYTLNTERELKRLGLESQPERIFNCDDTGVSSHVASRKRAYGPKGKTMYQQKVNIKVISL